MTIEDLFDLRSQINYECEKLLISKGADYSGEEDTLNNLRMGGIFGVTTRMGDKVWRLNQLSKNLMVRGSEENKVDESILDTVYDLRNYCDLFVALFTESGGVLEEAEQDTSTKPVEDAGDSGRQAEKGNDDAGSTRKTTPKVGIITGSQTTESAGYA